MCPNVIDILRSAGPDLAVRGRVLYFSDDGQEEDGFAVMDVEGIASPMVVPVECLRNFVGESATGQVDVCDASTTPVLPDPTEPGERFAASRVKRDCVESLKRD